MDQTTATITPKPKRRFARKPKEANGPAQPKVGTGRKAKATTQGKTASAARVTKSDTVIALLSRDEGATIERMCEATGWQQHSVRGFLAGTVRKKPGVTLTSEKADGVRTYHLTVGGEAPA